MSIGSSGRVVIEIEPDLKRELHAALRAEGLNLKTWFIEHAEEFLSEKGQLKLVFDDRGERVNAQGRQG
jgi:methylase of polypeptide subunit release factors